MSRVVWTFTNRNGGTSDGPFRSLNLSAAVGDLPERVAENRRRAAALAGLGPGVEVAVAVQEHGQRVIVVDEELEQAPVRCGWRVVGRADALVTARTNVALAVLVADCAPVLLADAARGWVAAVHAGWRGLAAGVIQEAVRALCRLSGGRPADLEARVGPCIRACCYEVGPEVARAVGRACRPRGGRFVLDVAEAARGALLEAGLDGARIQVDGRCTACREDLFYSYRRDGPAGGRMAGLVARVEA